MEVSRPSAHPVTEDEIRNCVFRVSIQNICVVAEISLYVICEQGAHITRVSISGAGSL